MASMKQITNIIAAIKTIYAYYARDTDVQALVKTWGMLLQEYEDEVVDKALYLCLQSCKTPPTPADLIDRIKAIQDAEEDTDEELWAQFTKALRKGYSLIYMFNATFVEANGKTQGANARDAFDRLWESLPEKLRMYMGGKGEFMRLARDYGEDDLKYERNRFMKVMPTLRIKQEYKRLSITSGQSVATGFLAGREH